MIKKAAIILAVSFLGWASQNPAIAAEEAAPAAPTEASVPTATAADKLISSGSTAPIQTISSESLSGKESKSLQKQTEFWYRNKQMLVQPSDLGFGKMQKEQAETDSKFRYYFDTAMVLYQENRLEEAREILKYLADEKPDDEYVAYYLARIDKETGPKKSEWLNKTKDAAQVLKKNEIARLLEEGVGSFDRKDYDSALLKFTDILAIDQENGDAKSYMVKIREHYAKKIRVEAIAESVKTDSGPATDVTEALLNKGEEKSASAEINASNKLLDDAQWNIMVREKRAAGLLNKAELESKIKEIVSKKQYEDKKSSYLTLGSGDTVQIIVDGHPELSGPVTVSLNGYVFLPVTNEAVIAKDMTLEELTDKIEKLMVKYIKNPSVGVEIVDYRSKLFYVVDESSCTPYPITRPNLTLLDALFMSDWGDDRALGRVLVIKPSDVHPIIKKVNAYDLVFRGKLASNIRIDNGDIIYVPTTIVKKLDDTISKTFAPLSSLNTAVEDARTLRGQRGETWSNLFLSAQ